MDSFSADFCNRVFGHLPKSRLLFIGAQLSSDLWSDSASYHLEKRRNLEFKHDGESTQSLFQLVEDAKKSLYARVTRIVVTSNKQPDEIRHLFAEALQYHSFDDDACLRICGVPKSLHTDLTKQIHAKECLFTELALDYMSAVSKKILMRHVEKGILRRVQEASGPEADGLLRFEVLRRHVQMDGGQEPDCRFHQVESSALRTLQEIPFLYQSVGL